MIRSLRFISATAMLLVSALLFTSCEGAFDDIFGEWSRPGTVTSISLTSTTLTLVVGEADVTLSFTLKPDNAIDKTVTWSSDNTAVATVDATGRVHAVAVGAAIITAKAGDKSATCTVTVTEVYAANEYNEGSWDGTKVIFTKQTAASVTAVANSDADVTWDAGWYTVSGNVTITGNVTLGAETHLILQDGATLTINGQLDCITNGKDLYIYGQKKGDGKLNVTNNSDHAINSDAGYRIDIHGGEVTASAAGIYKFGLYTGYLAVYGGKLTATSGDIYGIAFKNTINVYGGVVEAMSNATSSLSAFYGIGSADGLSSQILTVYGGKVTATGNGKGSYGSGFGCYVESGTSGIKFYFSDDGTTWGDGTSYASATKVGADAATKKKFAKAE